MKPKYLIVGLLSLCCFSSMTFAFHLFHHRSHNTQPTQSISQSPSSSTFHRGMYITQSTAENRGQLTELIENAKKYNIDTFIIDINIPSKRYAANVPLVIQAGIQYVARIVIFPHGGTHQQVTDPSIWAKRLGLAKYAIGLGAKAIQLDYIRYRAEYPPNPKKAEYILKVVNYFKTELKPYNVALQMDIFGISTIKPAHTIGQDPGALASEVNALCPMVYPSHFEPFRQYAVKPYETIFNSVNALKKQLGGKHPDVSIYAYIELYNYRYKLTHEERLKYIAAEMKGAHDSGASGWYVWTPNNYYKPLFEVLAEKEKAKKLTTEAHLKKHHHHRQI